jgi:hypothetical protein
MCAILPKELWDIIYSYDNEKKENFNKVMNEYYAHLIFSSFDPSARLQWIKIKTNNEMNKEFDFFETDVENRIMQTVVFSLKNKESIDFYLNKYTDEFIKTL